MKTREGSSKEKGLDLCIRLEIEPEKRGGGRQYDKMIKNACTEI